MENSMEVLYLTLKTELLYNPAIPLLGASERNKITILKRYEHPRVRYHCSQQPRHGNNLSVHWQMNGWAASDRAFVQMAQIKDGCCKKIKWTAIFTTSRLVQIFWRPCHGRNVVKILVLGHIIQHSETDCAEINVYISKHYIIAI